MIARNNLASLKNAENGFLANNRAEPKPSIAVLIPCYNEEITIADVIHQFKAQLPDAEIYVFDNNSSDRTVEISRRAGAVVFHERRQGKGYVVQSMFSQIDADIYVMVDGDGTYPPASVDKLIEPIKNREADMVVGSRLHEQSHSQFKPLNRFGNKLFLCVLNLLLAHELTDMLSGYRAFSRRLVKGLRLSGGGFEIETELTIKTLARDYRIVEVPIDLGSRPQGSHSKIRLVKDGWLILNTMMSLCRLYNPFALFRLIGSALIGLGLLPVLAALIGELKNDIASGWSATALMGSFVLPAISMIMAGLVVQATARGCEKRAVVREFCNGKGKYPTQIRRARKAA